MSLKSEILRRLQITDYKDFEDLNWFLVTGIWFLSKEVRQDDCHYRLRNGKFKKCK